MVLSINGTGKTEHPYAKKKEKKKEKESSHRSYTLHKNYLKIDNRLNYKVQN